MEAFKETVKLAPGVYVQASAEKFRVHRLLLWEVAPGCEASDEPVDPNITRQLLAGAFFAGFPKRSDQEQTDEPVNNGSYSLLRHIHSLAGSYQTTHATPPTMRRVAKYFTAQGQHAVAEYCLKAAKEESGHDTLALMDIAALGLPAEAFVARLRPQNALAMVEQFTRLADSNEPIATLGYAYALERMALFNTEESISKLEKSIPAGINATRCLRVHSSAGSTEINHVAESIEFMATLSQQDRARIAQATYATIKMQAEVEPDYPGDEAMHEILDEFDFAIASI